MAPSPTGPFHVGSARTALFNYLFARHHGGVFILRIEDTDLARSTEESLSSIYEGLNWLGLEWDEGPGRGGKYAPYVQSARLELYREFADSLLAKGLAYRCYCTAEELQRRREQMRAAGKDPKYDGRCRELTASQRARLEQQGRKPAVRFLAPREGETRFEDIIRGEVSFANNELDDFVILKSDGFPTYNFAAVVDDAMMEITHVIRGEDGISNTPRQILLYEAMELPVPRFAHLPLLLGKDRSKLSKRHGSTALLEFRDRGILPEAMLNFLALLGWSPGEDEGREIFSKEELIALFDLTRVNKSGAIFDLEKLEWMNGQYLRAISLERLTTLSLPYLREAGLIGERLRDGEQEYLAKALALGRERMRLLSDAPEVIGFFLREEIEFEEKTVERVTREKGTAEHLEKLRQRLQALSDFSKEKIEETLRTLAEELGIPASALIHPTRAALTGRSVGPGLFELMEVLGKERCVRRLAEFRRRFFSKAELPVGN